MLPQTNNRNLWGKKRKESLKARSLWTLVIQTISDDLRSNRPILLAEELLEIILKDVFLFENQPQ